MAKNVSRISLILILTTVIGLLPVNTYPSSAGESDNYRITYRAKKGDSLIGVSESFDLDHELVAAMNNMDPDDKLYQGQSIYLPREPEILYTLNPGDNLWNVAKIYEVNVNLLLAYNDISRPERLQVGQKIRIPVKNTEEEVVPVLALEESTLASRGTSTFFLPVVGVISSPYGWRRGEFHHGTDIAADTGTPIKAAKAGHVTFAEWRPIYGNTVIIDHGQGLKTVYGHASKILVKKGQYVRRGQIIANVGSTGRSTGPHLHFEVHINDETVNPMRYLTGI